MNLVIKFKQITKKPIPNRIRLLWYSNPPFSSSGYSKCSREILSRLIKDPLFEIHVASQYDNRPDFISEWGIIHGSSKWKPDNHAEALQEIIDKVKPDVIFFLEDPFSISYVHYHADRIDFRGAKTIFYAPLDAYGNPDGAYDILRRIDKIIPLARFGEAQYHNEGFRFVTKFIPHGVDLMNFFPVKNIEEKKELRKMMGIGENDFVIGHLSVNRARKNNFAWINALYPLLIEHPDMKVLAHVIGVGNKGESLIEYIQKRMVSLYGVNLIQKQILFTEACLTGKVYQDKEVANIYRVSDVFMNTACGEGLNFGILEASGIGIPYLTTDFSTGYELIIDPQETPFTPRGTVVPIDCMHTAGLYSSHANINELEFSKAIKYYYDNRNKIKEHGQNGRYFAELKFNWDILVYGKDGFRDQILDLWKLRMEDYGRR